MNKAHLHLLLNHVPVIGVLFGIALLIAGIVKQSNELKNAALVIFVGIALVVLPVFRSGKAAEEIVEDMPGVSESVIERHEDAAKTAMIAVEITGILALLSLVLSRRTYHVHGWLMILLLVLSLATGGLMTKTALLGGKIRHMETRAGFKVPEEKGENEENEKAEHKKHKTKKHKHKKKHKNEKTEHEEHESAELEKQEHSE